MNVKTDIYQPREEASCETNPADTLISKSGLQNCESSCLLWKPPVWGTLIQEPKLTKVRRAGGGNKRRKKQRR